MVFFWNWVKWSNARQCILYITFALIASDSFPLASKSIFSQYHFLQFYTMRNKTWIPLELMEMGRWNSDPFSNKSFERIRNLRNLVASRNSLTGIYRPGGMKVFADFFHASEIRKFHSKPYWSLLDPHQCTPYWPLFKMLYKILY